VIQQLIMLPEATTAHLPWLRTRLADYGPDVRARLLAGLFLPATAYPTGLRARRWYLRELEPLLARYDLLAAPAMPTVPPRLDEDAVPYRRGLIPFNSPWSLAGLPTASVPSGFVDGLPAGLALIGRPGEDAAVLSAAHVIGAARQEVVYKPQSVSKEG
jgi:aspartyl-tRNA(Asn)/glutamyl-tRNA(Gln) amidotransferase subunit A